MRLPSVFLKTMITMMLGIWVTNTVGADSSGGAVDMFLSQDGVRDVTQAMLQEQGRRAVRLSLQECVRRAMCYNLDVKVQAYGPAISMTDVVEAEAAFDAVLFGSAQFANMDRANMDSGFTTRTDTTPGGTVLTRVPTAPFDTARDYNYRLGLQKRLPTGATMAIAEKMRRYENTVSDDDAVLFYNPFYEQALELSLNQPLLRDFGLDFNRAAINTARNSYRISQQEFNLAVIEKAAEVEDHYWRLVLARQRLRIGRALVHQASVSLIKMQSREQLDSYAEVIHRNRGLIARAQATLSSSQSEIEIVQDQLLEAMNDPNLPVSGGWEVVPTDEPVATECSIDRVVAIDTALQMRPELNQQRLRLDTAGIAVGVAENQTLPRLDLAMDYGVTGAGHGTDDSWDQQWRGNTTDFSVGVSFEVPLGGNRAAQAGLTRARHQQRQENTRLESFLQKVLVDVSITLHNLENTYQEIQSRNLAAQAETSTLAAHLAVEESEGKITSDFLDRKLSAQERLANALLNSMETTYRYNLAIMNAYRAQGLLLQYNNIKLEELAPKSDSSR